MRDKLKPVVLAVTSALTLAVCQPAAATSLESFPAPASDPSTWYTIGQKEVADAKKLTRNNRQAKNVIFFYR